MTFRANDCGRQLVKVGHELEDILDPSLSYLSEKVITIGREIQASSLIGDNYPTNGLMFSLSMLMNDQKIQWAVIGGVALSVHGQLRSTEDIDIFVDRLPDQIKTRDLNYMNKFDFYRAKSSTGTVTEIDHRSGGYIEMMVADRPLRQWALESAINVTVLGCSVPIITAEEALVASKIAAVANNPEKRSARDIPDIMSVLLKNKNLNLKSIAEHLDDKENEVFNKILGINDTQAIR